ncbi:MAG: hypothetical protein OXD32_08135, partial [Endozoicomonadaceae bacterium]|nr:hypothetical protein [Endozoicomonadaceae bacterium]
MYPSPKITYRKYSNNNKSIFFFSVHLQVSSDVQSTVFGLHSCEYSQAWILSSFNLTCIVVYLLHFGLFS